MVTFGPPTCTDPTDLEVISYNFDLPLESIANEGSAGTLFDVTPTRVNAAGHPAKGRGLYFDGTSNGYVSIAGLDLSPLFSLHTWLLISATTGNPQTIFS